MEAVEKETVLGRSIKLRGELYGADNLSIDGDFEGVIRLEGAKVTIGQNARVRANIAAQDVIIFGKVEGEIRATGVVALRSHAIVLGDIFAARFSMEDEAALRGFVDPTRAAEPVPAASYDWAAGEETKSSPVTVAQNQPPAATQGGRLLEVRSSAPSNDSTERYAQMPAGLAAAARHFNEVISSASASHSGDSPSSGNSSELVETKA